MGKHELIHVFENQVACQINMLNFYSVIAIDKHEQVNKSLFFTY